MFSLRTFLLLAVAGAMLTVAGCSCGRDCSQNAECPGGNSCVAGSCVAPDAGSGGGSALGGGTATGGGSAGGGAAGGEATGGGSTGGGSAGGAGGGSAGGGTTGPDHVGTVGFYIDPIGAIRMDATFARAPIPTTCVTTTVDGCSLRRCTAPDMPMLVSAGSLTFRSVSVDGGVVMPNPNFEYALQLFGADIPVGESLDVTASGATFPAFAASIAAPPELTTATPTCAEGDCGILSRDAGFTATWPTTPGATVVITLSTTSTSPMQNTFATCPFDGALGTATISSAVMRGLDQVIQGNYNIAVQRQVIVDAGTSLVTLGAQRGQGVGGTFSFE